MQQKASSAVSQDDDVDVDVVPQSSGGLERREMHPAQSASPTQSLASVAQSVALVVATATGEKCIDTASTPQNKILAAEENAVARRAITSFL